MDTEVCNRLHNDDSSVADYLTIVYAHFSVIRVPDQFCEAESTRGKHVENIVIPATGIRGRFLMSFMSHAPF